MIYSAWTKNKQDLLECSSGGMFFEFAKKIINEGGYVVGVIMNGINANYVMTNDIEVVKRMRGSKYVKSNPAGVIHEIKSYQINKINNLILFTGLPCHIKAIKQMLNTSNMILVELRCHGLPIPHVFKEHVKNIAKGRKIKEISFRGKYNSWNYKSQFLKIEFKNGEIYKKKDDYLMKYLDNTYIRKHCKKCKIKNEADVTIGDFWKVPGKYKNMWGTSFLTLNTLKGKDFVDSINTIEKHEINFKDYLNVGSMILLAKSIIYNSLMYLGLLHMFNKMRGKTK